MKSMTKRMFVALLAAVLLFSCLCFTGCESTPYEIETYYLTSYRDENGVTHKTGSDPIAMTVLYDDDIILRYLEDKTFIFREFGKTCTGTYTWKGGSKETTVELTFSDGSKGSGTCARYFFDGTWFEATLEAFGKSYKFDGDTRDPRPEDLPQGQEPCTAYGAGIGEMLQSDVTKKYFRDPFTLTLIRGKVVLRDGVYLFVPTNSADVKEADLSQAGRLYTYEVAKDLSVARGNNELREGDCLLGYSKSSWRVKGEDEVHHSYFYAVWYYDTAIVTPEAPET